MSRLFNIHTDYGEGTVSAQQWISYAKDYGINELVFIDFVPPSRWEEYKSYMDSLDTEGIKVLYGVEVPAKVLKDTPVSLIDMFDIIAVSERCIGEDENASAIMEEVILDWTKKIDRLYWVRPGLWYREYGPTMLGLEYYVEILKRVPEDKIVLEVNRKYNVPPPYVPSLLDELGYSFVVGVDANSPDDLPRYEIPILGFTFADAEE